MERKKSLILNDSITPEKREQTSAIRPILEKQQQVVLEWKRFSSLDDNNNNNGDECLFRARRRRLLIAQFAPAHHQEANEAYAKRWRVDYVQIQHTASVSSPQDMLIQMFSTPQRRPYNALLVLGNTSRLARLDVDVLALLPAVGTKKSQQTMVVVPPAFPDTSLWDLSHPGVRNLLVRANHTNTTIQQQYTKVLRDFGPPLLVATNNHNAPPSSQTTTNANCAILFFGLPKHFRRLVLPSVQRNVLGPNPHCHVYAHTYNVTWVKSARNHETESTPLRVHEVADVVTHGLLVEPPSVFEARHNLTYLRDVYYPNGSAVTSWEYPTSFDNMMKQWHSIESVWHLMEQHAHQHNISYERVGLFRSDVLFVTPIIMMHGGGEAVVPWFSPVPVNDRMFYGSYQHAAVWATQRFASISQAHAAGRLTNGIHPERYLKSTILPRMQATFRDVCFLRVRATGAIQANDCYCNRHYPDSPFVIERPYRGYREFDVCPSVKNTNLASLVSCITQQTCTFAPTNSTEDSHGLPLQHSTIFCK